MTGQEPSQPDFSAEWVLRQLPVISYFCENDGLYTMRWLNAGGGNDLGYDLQDFVNNKHYFAASAIHPDDLDVVDHFAERALASQRPIVARYRLVHVEGTVLPVLVVARAVRDENGRPHGFCGVVLNCTTAPQLQGPSQVMTNEDAPLEQPGSPRGPAPGVPNPDWMALHSPVVPYVVEADESHTLRYTSGQAQYLLEYRPEDFLDNIKYRATNSVLPEDTEVADNFVDACAAFPGEVIFSRYRLVHATGRTVPTLYVARGVKLADRSVVVGIVLDVTHCSGLQGKTAILTGQR